MSTLNNSSYAGGHFIYLQLMGGVSVKPPCPSFSYRNEATGPDMQHFVDIQQNGGAQAARNWWL